MPQESDDPTGAQDAAENGRARFRFSYKVPPPEGSVGEALRQDREAKGWTQVEVAAQVGYHQTKISQYERGEIKHPPDERLIDLARLYGRADGYYIDLAGYPGVAKLADWRKRIAGAVVVEQPRAGLQEVIEALCQLTEPAFQRVATRAANELRWQHEGKGQQEDDATDASRDTA